MAHTHQKHHKKRILLRNIAFGAIGFGAIVVGIILIWVSTIQLPDFSSFDSRRTPESTKIYDRTGTIVLYDLNSDVKKTHIDFADMGDNIKEATVAIEDSSFYQHQGIRPKSILRAFLANLTHAGVVQGGSTITQQVVKKSLLSDEKTITRKIKEAVLALKLERELTKDQILEIYLNEIPYGGNVYGIAEASRTFLGKDPRDLTLAEAAYLAAIPNAPSRYSPFGSHRDLLDARKNLVLSRMHDLGIITDQQYESAQKEVVVFKEASSTGIKAPHFVFFIKEYLENKYGPDVVETGGLKVITTLDYDMQQTAEAAVKKYTMGEKKQADNVNGGLVAMDPKTGQILAMVGSRDYFDKQIDGNFNVALARRQPGSSFKPFVYATAFEKGFTPETMLFDVPTEFNSSCDPYGRPKSSNSGPCYSPSDFEGTFQGPVSIRNALAQSINIPAVKTLYMVGVKNAIKTAQDMGITTLTDPSRYGLALVLGGGEVRLLEMTQAYSAFATEGVRHEYTGVLRVEDKNGAVMEEWQQDPGIQAIPRNVALQISDILSDNVARTPTFGANSTLNIPGYQVAVKTGTTNDFKDSWTMGYTPSLAVGVWVGRNDGTPLPVRGNASSLWGDFMKTVLKNYPNETFEKPDPDPDYASIPPILRGYWQGNDSFTIDTVSGGLATDQTPKETRHEYVITDVHTILHWIDKNNPRGPSPTNPESDPLYNNWETAVRNWWAVHSSQYPHVTAAQKPNGVDSVHTDANIPKITITNPMQGSSVSASNPLTVSVTSTGPFPVKKIDVFLNNTYVGSAQKETFSFTPDTVPDAHSGENTLDVVGTDTVSGTSTASTTFILTQ